MSAVDPDIDAIVDDLRRQIAARRAAGDYPLGLERQLEAEFDGILASMHRHELGTADLAERVQALRWAASQVHAGSALDSRVPGGASVHGATARLVRRHTNELTDSVRHFAEETHRALAEVERMFDVQRRADERQLNEVMSAVLDRLATLDHLVEAVLDIEARLDRLEDPPPS